MKRNHEGMTRGFYHHAEAYYAKNAPLQDAEDEIMVGFYDGGTSGEFAIRWEQLGGRSVPQLQAYDDSWSALVHFKDLLDAMASIDSENISPEKFCKLLVSLGIKDLTERERK
jgi:hypothetical protein